MTPKTQHQARATRQWFSATGLAILAVGFIAFAVLNNLVLRGARLDLSESRLYTLSEGSKRLVRELKEPLNLYLYFSDSASKDIPELRGYAQRVRELLQQYAEESGGKLRLSVVDPQAFSEEEDRAAQAGLQAVPVGGTELYFGLVGTSSTDARDIIGFFQPDKEASLEYEISKLIHRLGTARKPTIGVLSGLPILGGWDMMTRQRSEPWVVTEQLRQFANLRELKAEDGQIPADLDALLVVQPKGLAPAMLYALDQYVLGGGKTLVFVDPVAEQDRLPQSPQMPFPKTIAGQDLNTLFKAWGFSIAMDKVVADPGHALQIVAGPGQGPITHLALLGLGPQAIAREDLITANLESLNFASTGAILPLDGKSTVIEPLVTSSPSSALLDRGRFDFLPDPSALQQGFVPGTTAYVLAARIGGKAKTAFPEGKPQAPAANALDASLKAKPAPAAGPHLAEATIGVNLLVVADTDVLSDRLWVEKQQFFGQTLANPFADNGDFLANAAEQFSGSEALVSLRGRGRYSRPFERVQALKAQAEGQLLAHAENLQKQLDDTEKKLNELQQGGLKGGAVSLNAEQQRAVQEFAEQKARIRKELREVRHQLDKDIDALGNRLKLINIVLVPSILILIAMGVAAARRGRRQRREGVGHAA
ncbi:MAG: Gldg family protein [Gammaproteobacteria bacterium]|nr:Gldg family protein [Gammaproteobacteria bacterium]